jgi:hypothetical protein
VYVYLCEYACVCMYVRASGGAGIPGSFTKLGNYREARKIRVETGKRKKEHEASILNEGESKNIVLSAWLVPWGNDSCGTESLHDSSPRCSQHYISPTHTQKEPAPCAWHGRLPEKPGGLRIGQLESGGLIFFFFFLSCLPCSLVGPPFFTGSTGLPGFLVRTLNRLAGLSVLFLLW